MLDSPSDAPLPLCARMRSPNLLLTSYPDGSFPGRPAGVIRFAFPHPGRSCLLGGSADVDEGRVPLTSLDPIDVGVVHAHSVREFFLGVAAGLS